MSSKMTLTQLNRIFGTIFEPVSNSVSSLQGVPADTPIEIRKTFEGDVSIQNQPQNNNADEIFNQAVIAQNSGQPDRAIELFKQAGELNPDLQPEIQKFFRNLKRGG